MRPIIFNYFLAVPADGDVLIKKYPKAVKRLFSRRVVRCLIQLSTKTILIDIGILRYSVESQCFRSEYLNILISINIVHLLKANKYFKLAR
jgi:hypothetical protein